MEGKAGEAIGTYLRRNKERNVWNQLRKEAEAEFQTVGDDPNAVDHLDRFAGVTKSLKAAVFDAPKIIPARHSGAVELAVFGMDS